MGDQAHFQGCQAIVPLGTGNKGNSLSTKAFRYCVRGAVMRVELDRRRRCYD